MIILISCKGREFKFDVSGSTTVRKLKYLLSSRVPCDIVDFWFAGQVMRDNDSLDYYDVEDGDTIIIVVLQILRVVVLQL